MAKPKILIVDDEKLLRDTLAEWFAPSYNCLTAPDAEQAMKIIGENADLSLMISDVKMPPDGARSGVELLKKAKAANPNMACILLTAYGTVDLAVEAMKDGADDFFQKPVTDLAQFEIRVAKAIKTVSLEREVASLKSQLTTELENFTGKSPSMEKVYQLIRKVAPTEATVLIGGPSGTGKELTAQAIHNLSKRSSGPFVAVECAALSASLLESELFGHEAGSFTDAKQKRVGKFEAADGGTLFLDEIGEIDLETQKKLLRVLETKVVQRVGGNADVPVDFRLVAATNKDLSEMVRQGTFREDLFYRLNVIDIRLPALKDRPGDIALLANRFLHEFSAANGGMVKGIDAKAMKALEDYDWPGNVRQLRNVIEKMVILASAERLSTDDLPVEITSGPAEPAAPVVQASPNGETAATLADAEKQKILATLAANNNNKSRTADVLGISRRTLHRKLNEWGMK